MMFRMHCSVTGWWERVILPVAIPFLLSGFLIGANRFAVVKRHCGGIVSDSNISAVNFIKKLIDLRDRTSFFSLDPSFLMQSEKSGIVYYIATK
jgi:hypothetical protein